MTFVKSEKRSRPLWTAASVCTAVLVPALFAACGGGSDLACGAGTVQKGDQCVAQAISKKDSGLEEGSTDSGAGGTSAEGSTGGSGGGAGGAAGTGGGGGSGGTTVDAGPPDEIQFGGITSASPANSTPKVDAGAITPDAIRVTWTAAHFPAKPSALIHYEVQQSLASGKESAAGAYIAPPGSTSFNVEGLETGKKYYFKVVAVVEGDPTAVDKVGPTKELSATPAYDDTAPKFDGATTASPAGPKAVTVKWKVPATDDKTASAGITYRVYWTPDQNGVYQLGAVSTPGATEVVVNGLPAADHAYFFKAIAVDAAGNADKNDVSIVGQTGSDTTPPVFGGCLAASDASATEATVTWVPAFDDTTPADQIVYKVYASDVTIAHDTPISALQPVGTFTGGVQGRVTGLAAASTYRFICHALDTFGNEDDNRVIQTVNTKDDGQAPTFAGATKAEAAPAIIGVSLTWPQATDDQTSDKAIVYNIYGASTPGGEDYSKLPLATATAGALGKIVTKDILLQIPNLVVANHVSNTPFYFVVRAADETGNVEKNTHEVTATTLISFEDDVQPIFTQNCAIGVCHTVGADGTNPPIQGQDLDDHAAYSNIVNVVAREGTSIPFLADGGGGPEPNIKRIDGTNTNPHASYLWRKITGTPPFYGNQMPPPQASRTLTAEQKMTLENWVRQGAPEN
jgi:hypothetical protein